MAGSPKAEDLPKPINAISYASPRVGDENYLKSYQDLEKKGKVRHIRISNQGDLVPVAPSVGYYQTGLNLHVRDNKKMQVGYSKDRGIFGQFSPNSLDMHNLDYYHERLFIDENSVDIRLSIDELYEKHADISLL